MQLNFQRYGAGFPLIILHGLFGSLDNWQTFARQWGQTYQVLAVDLRNHGRSPHADAFDYEVMTADLVELFRAQNFSRADILGHSLGGKVAMNFALHQPASVEKLIVADMAPREYPPTQLPIFQALLALDLAAFRERGEIVEALKPAIPDAAMRQFLVKNVTRDQTGAFHWKMNLPVIHQNYGRLNAALPADRAFEGPTLFIRGGRSNYVTAADEKLITRLFPHAAIATIPKAGHWLHADAPKEFAALVAEFLIQ